MTDKILRLTTTKGHSMVLDATTSPIKVALQTETASHNFTLVALRQSAELGNYLEALPSSSIQISAEDAAKVRAFMIANPKKKKVLPFVLGGVGVLVILGIIGSMNSTPSAPGASAPQAVADIPAPIGNVATVGDAEVTVSKALTRNSVGGDNEYLKESAAEGGVLVVIEYKIKNIGTKPMKSFDQPRLKLIDDHGTEYSPDVGKSGSYASEVELNRKMMSDLNPDISVTDADVFEVSKTKFNPTTWYAVTKDGTKLSLQ